VERSSAVLIYRFDVCTFNDEPTNSIFCARASGIVERSSAVLIYRLDVCTFNDEPTNSIFCARASGIVERSPADRSIVIFPILQPLENLRHVNV
jgi:hypothetical protein